jgi:hypothetical protein
MRLRAEAGSQDAGKGKEEGVGGGEAAQRVKAWGSNLSYIYKLAGTMVVVSEYVHVCLYVHVYVSTHVNVYVDCVCVSSPLPPTNKHTLPLRRSWRR